MQNPTDSGSYRKHPRTPANSTREVKVKDGIGVKIHLGLFDSFSFLDTLSWEVFIEGKYLTEYVEKYRARFGFYPAKVLTDKIYCMRENRKWLQDWGIKLAAKPLDR